MDVFQSGTVRIGLAILVVWIFPGQWVLLHGKGIHRAATRDELWALQPLPERSQQKQSADSDENPVDEILGHELKTLYLQPFPEADRATLLRRLSFDLIGLPPSLEEQEEFFNDSSDSAYETLVDRLLESPQHGVRYARHWLDVLRYTDIDERMPAASSIYLWRDWVIRALNRNLAYDAFVRTQISGFESRKRTTISATGNRRKTRPRPDNQFALGFLSRGATSQSNGDHALGLSAVETISSAFLGMTVQCAKCHDHFYDPISQEDYYRMKALFDPLALREIPLAEVGRIVQYSDDLRAYENKKSELEAIIDDLIKPYHRRLYDERVSMLPGEIQVVIRKPESLRSADEQKIADDYFPVLRIDVPKIREIMPKEELDRYDDLRKRLGKIRGPKSLPVFLTVHEDPKRLQQVSYVLNTGDPSRPDTDHEVRPGFPFEPAQIDFREGRRETFVDWLTSSDNALFARVAVNRIWQWHFGKGLHAAASDFGSLPAPPKLRALLDRLASEFIQHDFDMKWLHKRIVMSGVYRRASASKSDLFRKNDSIDPNNETYWKFPLRRLEAELIRDAILTVAGRLDRSQGGPSYVVSENPIAANRRAIYMKRGFQSNGNQLPEFLDAFNAQDGRESCARREETVTAPQALWLMNNPLTDQAADAFGSRLEKLADDDPERGVIAGFRIALGRVPDESELRTALDYLNRGPEPFKRLAWMLINLDEFIYIR